MELEATTLGEKGKEKGSNWLIKNFWSLSFQFSLGLSKSAFCALLCKQITGEPC